MIARLLAARREFETFAARCGLDCSFDETRAVKGAEGECINAMSDCALLSVYFYTHASDAGEQTSLEHALWFEGIDEKYIESARIRTEFFQRFSRTGLLYFADVDNTMTERGVLSDEKKKFFNGWNLSKNVVLSTGKIFKSIEKTAKELGLERNSCCCLNGAVLYDGLGGERLVSALGQRARPAARLLAARGVSYVLYYPDALRVEGHLRAKDLENLERYDELFLNRGGETDFDRVVKLLAFVDEGDVERETIVADAAALVGLNPLRTAPHSFEIVPPDTDKGRALRLTAEAHGKYFRQSVAVGDSMNDLPMLDSCGLPFAVCDASPALSAFCFPIAGKNRKTDIPELFSVVSEGCFYKNSYLRKSRK